jgi:signal transduction histidine kinase
MNPVAEQLTGCPAESAKGTALEQVVHLVDEDTRKKLSSPVTRVLNAGADIDHVNHTLLVSGTGNEVSIVTSAAPIVQHGEIQGAVVILSDMTEMKAAESARRESEIMQRLVKAQETDRHRIARDLHDQLGQRMTALRLKIESLSDESADKHALCEAIKDVQASASHIDSDIGFLSWELHPTELEELGVVDALRSYVREWSSRYGIAAEFHVTKNENIEDETELDPDLQTSLYRIAQEALNNVIKHADAGNVEVLIRDDGNSVCLIIVDDGIGFEPDAQRPQEQTGLTSMQERTKLLNGELEIESSVGTGTTIIARVPVRETLTQSA